MYHIYNSGIIRELKELVTLATSDVLYVGVKASTGWKNDFGFDKRGKVYVQCCAPKTRCENNI